MIQLMIKTTTDVADVSVRLIVAHLVLRTISLSSARQDGLILGFSG